MNKEMSCILYVRQRDVRLNLKRISISFIKMFIVFLLFFLFRIIKIEKRMFFVFILFEN